MPQVQGEDEDPDTRAPRIEQQVEFDRYGRHANSKYGIRSRSNRDTKSDFRANGVEKLSSMPIVSLFERAHLRSVSPLYRAY